MHSTREIREDTGGQEIRNGKNDRSFSSILRIKSYTNHTKSNTHQGTITAAIHPHHFFTGLVMVTAHATVNSSLTQHPFHTTPLSRSRQTCRARWCLFALFRPNVTKSTCREGLRQESEKTLLTRCLQDLCVSVRVSLSSSRLFFLVRVMLGAALVFCREGIFIFETSHPLLTPFLGGFRRIFTPHTLHSARPLYSRLAWLVCVSNVLSCAGSMPSVRASIGSQREPNQSLER